MTLKQNCVKCAHQFEFSEGDTWWDTGASDPVRLVKCPECGTVQAVEYWEEPDRESWYYDYSTKLWS